MSIVSRLNIIESKQEAERKRNKARERERERVCVCVRLIERVTFDRSIGDGLGRRQTGKLRKTAIATATATATETEREKETGGEVG